MAKFSFGQLLATPGALSALEESDRALRVPCPPCRGTGEKSAPQIGNSTMPPWWMAAGCFPLTGRARGPSSGSSPRRRTTRATGQPPRSSCRTNTMRTLAVTWGTQLTEISLHLLEPRISFGKPGAWFHRGGLATRAGLLSIRDSRQMGKTEQWYPGIPLPWVTEMLSGQRENPPSQVAERFSLSASQII